MKSPLKKIETLQLPVRSSCPVHELISRLGDKWSIFVLLALEKGEGHHIRFSDLMREVNGISQRMLTNTLRYMERDGIVTRKLFPQIPSRVEYTLTERGKALLVPIHNLVGWIRTEWTEIDKSRQLYDANGGSEKWGA